MKALCAALTAFPILASSGTAWAWGLHSGETLGEKDDFATVEAGWPDVTLGARRGVNDRLDVGAQVSFTYGLDGTPHSVFGIGALAKARYSLLKSPTWSAYAHGGLGLKFDAFSPAVLFGFTFPIGAEAGYHLTKEATLSAGADIPFYLNLTQAVVLVVPPMVGPGFEYQPDEHVSMSLSTRFGAALYAGNGTIFTNDVAFVLQAGFGYRM